MPQLLPKPKMCPGADCPGCSSANCMASGGEIKGVNKANPFNPSESEAGSKLRQSQSKHTLFPETKKREAKELHKQTLGELKMMPKPKLYARGGEIDADRDDDETYIHHQKAELNGNKVTLRIGKPKSPKGLPFLPGETVEENKKRSGYSRGGEVAADEDAPHIKGVHKSFLAKNDAGMSESGLRLRQGKEDEAKGLHKQTLSDMKSMPKPKLMAEGGEVEHEDHDDELHGMLGEELMDAFDSKDKKRMMDSIEAIVMRALSKE